MRLAKSYLIILMLMLPILSSSFISHMPAEKDNNSKVTDIKPNQRIFQKRDALTRSDTRIRRNMNKTLPDADNHDTSFEVTQTDDEIYYPTKWVSRSSYHESKFVKLKLSLGPVKDTAIADLDGDGYQELIGAHGYWIRVDKYSVTSGSVIFMWEKSVGCNLIAIEVRDINNDDSLEIVYLGEHVLGIMDASGNIQWEIYREFRAMSIEDIDGDNLYEIIAGDTHGIVYKVEPDGTFSELSNLGSSVHIIKVADLSPIGLKIIVVTDEGLFLLSLDGIILSRYDDLEIMDVDVGDINSDNEAEILIGTKSKVISLNYTGQIEWSMDSINTKVAVGDVDNDGVAEFVISNASILVLFEGYGSSIWTFNVGNSTQKLLINQVEGDANLEIVSLVGTNLYVINDDGSLYFNQNLAGTLLSAAIGNIDSDTGNEVFVGSSNNLAYLLEDTGGEIWEYEYSGDAYSYGGMLADDLDNDGKPELVITHVNPSYLAFYDDDLGLLWRYPVYIVKLMAEDINNDGYKEIIGLNGDMVYALSINGDLLFSGSYSAISGYWYESKALDFYDYDGDGFKEIFIAGYDYVRVINYTGKIEKNINITNSDDAEVIDLVDLDDDSRMEIIIGCSSGNVYALEMEGTEIWSFSTGNSVYDLEAYDVDLDGNYEIIVGSSDGKVYVISSDGRLKWSYTTGGEIRDVEIANLDDDDPLEIIIATSDGETYVFEDTGTIKWQESMGYNHHHVSIEDINWDDIPEIIIAYEQTSIWILNGKGTGLYYDYEYTNGESDIGLYSNVLVCGGSVMPRVIFFKYINATIMNVSAGAISTKTGKVAIDYEIDTNDKIFYHEVYINGSLQQILNATIRGITLNLANEAAYNVSIRIVTAFFDIWLQVWVIYDKTAPIVDIASPQQYEVVPAEVPLNLTFSDNVAGLGKIEVFLNDSLTKVYVAGDNITEYNGVLYTKFSEKFEDFQPNDYHSGSNETQWELYIPGATAIRIYFYRIYLDTGIMLYIYDSQGHLVENISGWIETYNYKTGWIFSDRVIFKIINEYNWYWEVIIDGCWYQYPSELPSLSIPDNGYWNLTIVALDLANNSASRSVVIKADVTPPTINIISPVNRYNSSNSQIEIRWNANDYWTGLDYFVITGNITQEFSEITCNVTMIGYESNCTFDLKVENAIKFRIHFQLIYLDYNIKLRIKDKHGDIVETYRGYMSNSSIFSPWITGDVAILEIENPDYNYYEIRVDYLEAYVISPKIISRDQRSYNLTVHSEGIFNLTILAVDIAGNIATDTIIIIYDATPPTGQILFPSDNYITNSSWLKLKWTASDALTGYYKSIIYLDHEYVGETRSYEYNLTVSSEGEHNVTIEIYDWARNVYTLSITRIIFDRTPPDITYYIIPRYPSTTDRILVRAEVSDQYGVASVFLVVNNGSKYEFEMIYNSSTGYYEYTLPCMQNGTNVTLFIKAYDKAGNKRLSNPHSFIVTLDSDNDGLSDYGEGIIGTDPNDPDTDDDGITDGWEVNYDLNPKDPSDALEDPDNDGLTNRDEFRYNTNPWSNDTDHDRMPDGWEVLNGLDPTRNDAREDLDGDQLANIDEYYYGTDPRDPDTDDDGLNDYDELVHKCDPLNPDTDGDGLPDGVEVSRGLNPLAQDTDGDFLIDSIDLFPTLPFVDYGIAILIPLGLFKSVAFIRAFRFRGRLRSWLEKNLDDKMFRVEDVAKAAKVPMKYVLSPPIGVISSDKKRLYSLGFLRKVLSGLLSKGGIDLKQISEKLGVSDRILADLLRELKAIKSEESGWYYSQEVWYGIPSLLEKFLGDSYYKVKDIAVKLRIHPKDITSKLPEGAIISKDESIPLEDRLVYSPESLERLKSSFAALLDKHGVLLADEIAEKLGVPSSDLVFIIPGNAIKSLDGRKYYSTKYLETLVTKIEEILAETLTTNVEELAKELNVSVEELIAAVIASTNLVLSHDMSKIYHEDFVFNKLAEISKQYADIPVDEAANMIGISSDDLLNLVQRWISEAYVPIRVSYDRTRLAFIGELRKFVEIPEPKGLKFE